MPIDWGDLKPISQGKQRIDWGNLQPIQDEQSSQTGGISFPKIGIGKKINPNANIEEMKRTGKRHGKVAASEVLGLPGDLLKLVSFGQADVPTSEWLKKAFEHDFPSTAALSPEEKEEEENLGLLTALALPVPGVKFNNPKIGKFFSKIGNRFKSGKKIAEESLKKEGKALGLTDQQLAPIFSGKFAQFFSKFSNKGKKAADAVRESQTALGNVYENLASHPNSKNFIPVEAEDVLIDGLKNFRQKLTTNLANSGEEKAMISFAQEALDKLINKSGVTAEELMNFYRSIGSNVNWKSLTGGKKRLAEIKKYTQKALTVADPSLGKKFNRTNNLWERSEKVLEAVGPKKINEFMDYSAPAALIGSLFTGNFAALPAVLSGMAAKKAVGMIATKMVSDPKWQNVYTKALKAIKNNSPKTAQSILALIKPLAKEDLSEEEYNSIFENLD